MALKTPMVRSKKYREGGRGLPCVVCGADDGTVVGAHYSGMWANRVGKGAGIKSHDVALADLCHACHTRFDSYENGRDAEAALEFWFAIADTMIRRIEQGLLRVG